MTVAWMVLMVLGLLVFFAGYCWMLVMAFKESAVWGVAALFILPYMMKRWDEAKLPLFGCIAGLALTVFGAVGYSMSSVNAGIEEYVDLGEQVAWEAPTIQPVAIDPVIDYEPFDPAEDQPVEVDPGVGEVDELLKASAQLNTMDHEEALSILDEPSQDPPPRRPHRDGVLVPLSELNSRQGERVVFVLNSLERVSAYVVGVENQTVKLRQRVGGGSVTYTVDLRDIKEARSRRVP